LVDCLFVDHNYEMCGSRNTLARWRSGSYDDRAGFSILKAYAYTIDMYAYTIQTRLRSVMHGLYSTCQAKVTKK
jgi:hypothetical protein